MAVPAIALNSEERFFLGVERSVKSRVSYGGTAPVNVRKQARGWLRKLSASS